MVPIGSCVCKHLLGIEDGQDVGCPLALPREDGVDGMQKDWGVSIQRACKVLPFATSSCHYKCRRTGPAAIRKRIKSICETHVRYGYRRLYHILRREGWVVNARKVYSLYRELGLQLRNKTPKRRVKAKLREHRAPAVRDNDVWAMDFVHDQLATGLKLHSESVNTHWFLSLEDACEKLDRWRRHYNEERSHSAIGNSPPIMLANPTGGTGPPDPSSPRLGSSAEGARFYP